MGVKRGHHLKSSEFGKLRRLVIDFEDKVLQSVIGLYLCQGFQKQYSADLE